MLNRQWLTQSRQAGYLTLTCLALACALVGVALPLIPATPFLLIAAWAAPKSSPPIHRWLLGHPQLGPILSAWHEQGAVPASAKWLACMMLTSSWLLLAFSSRPLWLLILSGACFIAIATFIVSRPLPASARGVARAESREPATARADIRAFQGIDVYADIRGYQEAEVYHE